MGNSTGTIVVDKTQPIVEQGSYSGVAQADFTDLDTRYLIYELDVYRWRTSTSGTLCYMRTSTDNGSSFDTTSYAYLQEGLGTSFALAAQAFTGQTFVETNYAGAGNGANVDLYQTYTIWKPRGADYTNVFLRNWGTTTTPELWAGFTGGIRQVAEDVNAFRLYPSSGTATFDYTLTGWRA